MDKKKILEVIKKLDKENDYDLSYDFDTEKLFHDIDCEIGLLFDIVNGGNDSDSWLQCEYWSNKIGKQIIYDCEVGNFDDHDEVADYIINTTKEIKSFEDKLTKI